MPHIPRLFCSSCVCMEMKPVKNGMTLQVNNSQGPYYKIKADRWQCPECGNMVYIPAAEPFAEHYQPGFSAIQFDDLVFLSDAKLPMHID